MKLCFLYKVFPNYIRLYDYTSPLSLSLSHCVCVKCERIALIAESDGTMEANKPTTMMCTVVGVDHTCFSYRACSVCERTLPDDPSSLCRFCNLTAFPRTKRFFRILVSFFKLGSFKTWFFKLWFLQMILACFADVNCFRYECVHGDML